MITPGSMIGIIGGGQLGRMLALAAAPLGYRTHILDPDPDCCAGRVAAALTVGDYGDAAVLARFVGAVAVVTYEFENVDPAPLAALSIDVHPPPPALGVAQDRASEKRFAQRCGARTAAWREVNDLADLDAAAAAIGTPAILKTRRFGYDGKGQARIRAAGDTALAWREIGGQAAILEAHVAFEHEFSILAVRGIDGTTAMWDAPVNVHCDGILDTSTVPAPVQVLDQVHEARTLASRIADALDYVGVLAIEFFASADGPVFNEMAPRVHNSGHWTIEGAITSQFENHIRAICGLPLGDTGLVGRGAHMTNLIGADVDGWPTLAAQAGTHLHLYDKGDALPGRKMGHVTRLA